MNIVSKNDLMFFFTLPKNDDVSAAKERSFPERPQPEGPQSDMDLQPRSLPI